MGTDLQAAVELPELTNGDYHADTSRVSHSMSEVYRRSPVEYAARFVHKTMPAPEPTPAMCFGTALHTLLLEPDRFDETVAVAPDCDRRTREGKEIWSQFSASCNNGSIVITKEQELALTRMAKSVLAHPEARKLFQHAEYREQTIHWHDEQSGIACKSRPDLLWVAGGVIGDIKTAADPTPESWPRQAATLGYHRQNAFYRMACEAAFGRRFQFLHIVVGSSEPFECCCYFMDPAAVERGEFQVRQTLGAIAESMRSNHWLAEQNERIKVVTLPKWAFYEN